MVSAASSSTSRTPLIEVEQTSSDKAPSTSSTSSTSSTQPFTDVLIEATSKVLRDGLDKPEALSKVSHKADSTNAVAFENAQEERPGSRSKKSVLIDISTQPVPIVVPPVPPVATETAPVAPLKIAQLVEEPAPKQAKVDAVTTIDVQGSKPSAPFFNVDTAIHPGLEHRDVREPDLGGPIPAVSPKAVVSGVPEPKVIAHVEGAHVEGAHVEGAQPVESREKSPTLTAEAAKPVSARSEISSRPPLLVNDVVVAPDVHIAPPATTGSAMETKPILLREPSIRATAKPTAPASEHVSSIRVSTQIEAVPIWPTAPSVVLSGGDAVAAPSHLPQSPSHVLDVGTLVGAISRPLVEAREGYTVMIVMHPVELGHLQAAVTLHGSDLHVLITPQTQMGHDALTSAVDTLKIELSRGGVNVNVTLQDPGSHPRGGDRPATASSPGEVFIQEESVAIASALPVLSDNQINLVL